MIQSSSLHAGIIMDGNGRWAERQGLSRTAGHRAGARAVEALIEAAPQAGIGVLTLYAFSSDNWKRPMPGVAALMRLFRNHLRDQRPRAVTQGVAVEVIGRRDRLPAGLLAEIARTESATHAGRRNLRGHLDRGVEIVRLEEEVAAHRVLQLREGPVGRQRLPRPKREQLSPCRDRPSSLPESSPSSG